MKLTLAPWKKNYDQPRQHIKKQRYYFANKGLSSQSYGFSSGHVWMWELDRKESWVQKNWCFWTVVLEKTLESPWTARRSNQSILKEIRPDYSLEGRMLRLKLNTLATWCEELMLWKHPDAGKHGRREEKGVTEDEMAGWHQRLNVHEFEQARGVGDGQGGLVCCSPWGHKTQTHMSDWTEMDCTPRLQVHGILQARKLEWVVISFSCILSKFWVFLFFLFNTLGKFGGARLCG